MFCGRSTSCRGRWRSWCSCSCGRRLLRWSNRRSWGCLGSRCRRSCFGWFRRSAYTIRSGDSNSYSARGAPGHLPDKALIDPKRFSAHALESDSVHCRIPTIPPRTEIVAGYSFNPSQIKDSTRSHGQAPKPDHVQYITPGNSRKDLPAI